MGKCSLYYKHHTPPLLVLLGCSALIIVSTGMLNLLSLIGMEESRNISHKHMISISLTFMEPSMRDNLVKTKLRS